MNTRVNMKPAGNNNLTEAQRKTLQRFEKKLAQEMPKLRIEWAKPYNDKIVEFHLEYDKRTYRKSKSKSVRSKSLIKDKIIGDKNDLVQSHYLGA